MPYLLALSWPRPLLPGLALSLFAAGGCTVNPPGPVVTNGGIPVSAVVNTTPKDYAAYDQLVWSDEFNDAALDQTKWSYEVKDVWYNNELEATTASPSNVAVSGGNLVLTALKQSYNGRAYTSARLNTKGKQEFVYGRYDVRAKLPKGKGLWPAIWMLGANDTSAGWPACGEIDIMELKGSNPLLDFSTIHFGTSVATHQYKGTSYAYPGAGDLSTDFHVFSLVRGQDKMSFYVDEQLYYSLGAGDAAPYPFNGPFYGILNLAVGGDFDGNPDASTTFPQTMQVDYVRFYQYKQ